MNTIYNRIPDNSDIVLSKISAALSDMDYPDIPSDIPGGDMPGDHIKINDGLVRKAKTLFPLILEQMQRCIPDNGYGRAVVSVCGGSGVGKSVIASILSYMFNSMNIGCYTMSGDNYPHRIPKENDAERLRIYNEGGAAALDAYLGSPDEVNFDEVNSIISAFKNGADTLTLKRMGRDEDSILYEDVDMSSTQILILEWTHGNSEFLKEVDIPILLNSTPEETLKYRQMRGRDEGTDSPFTSLVLRLEQDKLTSQASRAKIILTRSGEVIDHAQFKALMDRPEGE